MTAGPLVLAPLRIEAWALRGGIPRSWLVRTGSGPRRAALAAADLAARRPAAVAVAGVAGGLGPATPPGTVVVADRVVAEDGRVVAVLPSAGLLAADLAARGLAVAVGPVVSTPRIVTGSRRADLHRGGALAVDTETAYLLDAPWTGPAAVVRVVADTPERELWSPAILTGGARALRVLAGCAPSLARWAAAVTPRRVLLAGPRSFCAGVERAITTVERAIERDGAPVYVRRQIVHNRHVVEALEAKGAVFVEELAEVPDGATVVFSAHGVAPSVRREAARRDLRVVDATCPLVAKVHHEARRFSERGYSVVLIGHAGHDETEGTLGEAPGITLVESVEDLDRLRVPDAGRIAYVTQTTLSPADVAGIVEGLSARYPAVAAPAAADICYATANRQEAVAAMAPECDLVLVVGSANSSNAARLVEVAERLGCPAQLVDDERSLGLERLAVATTVGVTAAASTPPALVDGVLAALSGLGPVSVEARVAKVENVHFPLPAEVR